MFHVISWVCARRAELKLNQSVLKKMEEMKLASNRSPAKKPLKGSASAVFRARNRADAEVCFVCVYACVRLRKFVVNAMSWKIAVSVSCCLL